MADKAPRGAVLQFEIDRKRVSGYPQSDDIGDAKTVSFKYRRLLQAAMLDTLNNGGTFVLVVSPNTITAVQRPDAEEL